jgi:hypothetical protein
MARYIVTVRETLAVEQTVVVEAESRNAAFRVAEDPDNWVDGEPPYVSLTPLGREGANRLTEYEVLEVSAMSAEREEDDAEGA